MKTYSCKFCGSDFTNRNTYANHIRWKHLKISFSEEGYKNLHLFKKKLKIKEIVSCFKCGKKFSIKHFFSRRKEKYFCSRSCANSKTNSGPKPKPHCLVVYPKTCIVCGHVYCKNAKTQTCCAECSLKVRYPNQNSLAQYRRACKFKFSLSKFPDEFDGELLRKYGMYSAVNHGNNKDGVSRDHMISVKWGFEHNVPPEVISHPANCKIVLQKDNFRKRDTCSISLKELHRRIASWGKRYSKNPSGSTEKEKK